MTAALLKSNADVDNKRASLPVAWRQSEWWEIYSYILKYAHSNVASEIQFLTAKTWYVCV